MRALVTGGAGFIGSHIVDRLIDEGAEVTVLDDLSAGREENIHPKTRMIVGDVSDPEAADQAVRGAEVVFHQAAHRAVLRSVEHPLATDTANVHGTVTVLDAARRAGVRRVVYASSSSVYGNIDAFPTSESNEKVPRSPYAVSKLAGEHYCRVWSELYGVETVSLRYFNVYGPRQRPDSAYAAVIPLFIDALRNGRPPEVHGDGLQSRDFSYIDDVIAANMLAATSPASRCDGKAYNVAGGSTHTLLELLTELQRILGTSIDPVHVASRAGDVRKTQADVAAAVRDLGFSPAVSFSEGLERTAAAW